MRTWEDVRIASVGLGYVGLPLADICRPSDMGRG